MDGFLDLLGAAVGCVPLYGLPAALGVVPALISLRHRGGQAHLSDWATLCLPPLVWILVTELARTAKSLGNLGELP